MYAPDLLNILQGSIAPVVMISGIGLLLLSMTNRLSRPIDRIRVLLKERNAPGCPNVDDIESQINVFYHRCKLLRLAIAFASMSILFVSSIILTVFVSHFVGFNLSLIIKLLFTTCILSLILSLVFFMLDIKETLDSLHIEIKSHMDL